VRPRRAAEPVERQARGAADEREDGQRVTEEGRPRDEAGLVVGTWTLSGLQVPVAGQHRREQTED